MKFLRTAVDETAPWTVPAALGIRFSTMDSSRVLPLKASCLFPGLDPIPNSEIHSCNTKNNSKDHQLYSKYKKDSSESKYKQPKKSNMCCCMEHSRFLNSTYSTSMMATSNIDFFFFFWLKFRFRCQFYYLPPLFLQ